MFALFGEISFETIGSPHSIESRRSFDYTEHRVLDSRPRLQWTGNGLETIALKMLFHASFTDPAAQLEALLAAASDHRARALVFGDGTFRGLFVAKEVTTNDLQLGSDGSPFAIRVRVQLREWVAGAEFDPQAPPVPDTVPLGLAPSPVNYLLPAPTFGLAAPTAAYVAPTFVQPGVSPLVDNPAPSGPGTPDRSYVDVAPSAILRSA